MTSRTPPAGRSAAHAPAAAPARRRAAVVAAVSGLLLLPWFWVTEALVAFEPTQPPLGAPDAQFVDFYVGNADRIPWSATLYVGQWALVLVLVVSTIRAATDRPGLVADLARTLAAAATAVYAGAEGVGLWPVLAANMSADALAADLDPGLAAGALLSRDGLHAPAALLLGLSVLLVAWMLATSDLWARRVMSGLAAFAGAFALSSAVVGPEGFGPGFIFVLWAPVAAVLLLVGLRRGRDREALPAGGDARGEG